MAGKKNDLYTNFHSWHAVIYGTKILYFMSPLGSLIFDIQSQGFNLEENHCSLQKHGSCK